MKIGIFDHLSQKIGGGQLVAAQMAAQLSRDHDVEFIHSGEGYSLSSLAKAFEVDLGRVRERVVRNSHESFNLPGHISTSAFLRDGLISNRKLTQPYDLFMYSGHGVPPFSSARRGVIYCHFPFEGDPEVTLNSSVQFKNRSLLSRWIRLAAYDCLWKYRMSGYQTVLTNSQFTAQWIKRSWKKEAQVVYPPVSLQAPVVEKRNVIVSIGRFIDCHNSKNHMQQLNAFAALLGKGGAGWRLNLIGFCAMIPKEVAYLEELRRAARDLPVTFIVNADRNVVVRHLAEARLFWHTTGLSDRETTDPAKMEHFGIATVEAMLAGCVPLAPAQGGQVEIVEHGLSGYLCRNTEELVEYSVRLASDEQLLCGMSRHAVERGLLFKQSVFEQGIYRVVSKCLEGLGATMSSTS